MQTLTINSKAHEVLARAAEKARTEKPLVRKTAEYGKYEVRSTSNKSLWYTVQCNSEAKEITCNCPAKKPCKHIAAVAPLHSYIARQLREAAEQAAPALPVCECGKPAFSLVSGEWKCITCIKTLAAKEDAEQALNALVVNGVVTTSIQEIDDLVEQAIEKSLDRDCPACGLVQPDDDSSDCWCCGATLNPDDVDLEYSDEQAAFDHSCLFG